MIFDYNPITGLNYYSYHKELELNLEAINISQEELEKLALEWTNHVKTMGIAIVDPTPISDNTFSPIISNVPYEVFKKRVG